MDKETTDKIMIALNNDKEAKRNLADLNEAAKKYNVSDTDYEKARELIIMASIHNCPEAMEIMAESAFNQINH